MSDLVERLHQRAESYRQSGPSAEHTARLLDEAAVAIVSAESSAEYNAAMVEPLRQRIEVLMTEARSHDEKLARALNQADVAAEDYGNALNELDDALDALRSCQSVLAAITSPNSIQQTTVINVYAQAVEAECKARAVLAKAGGAS